MLNFKNYYQTAKDITSGKTSLASALKAAVDTDGGILGNNSVLTNRGINPLAANAGSALKSYFGKSQTGTANKNNTSSSSSSGSTSSSDNSNNNSIFPSINDFSSSSSNSNNSKLLESIGKDWDNAKDSISDVKKSLKTNKNYISNLKKVRDKYLTNLDTYKTKTDEAIAGNKELIQKNQKNDLDTLADDTRQSIDNTNIMLGVRGASGGSASRAAARAIASKAGKSRANVLTSYGDEMSNQNQESENALEEYNIRKQQAYNWEEEARANALDDYNRAKKALDRLERKRSGWKKEDIKAESDRNLQKLLSTLDEINAQSNTFMKNLAEQYSGYGGLADELALASVDVDAPAELATPEFNENINLTESENAEDWYDPNNTGKKVIKGYDLLGNPIYEESV